MLSLKNIICLNAASCLVFGVLFALLPGQVAMFLSHEAPAPQWLILLTGIALIVNGLHLLWASTMALPKKWLILYFSIGDVIWVIVSIGLLVSGVWITTTGGVLATVGIAVMVGCFGILQVVKRKAMPVGHAQS